MSSHPPTLQPSQAPQPKSALLYADILKLKVHRLTQVLRVTQMALLVISIITITQGRYFDAIIMLITGTLLFSVDWTISKQRPNLGSWILLTTLTLSLTYLAWHGSGLRDMSILGFCAVLIFAALLGDKRLLICITLTILTICLGIAYANQVEWHRNPVAPNNLLTGVIASIILLVISFSVWLMAHDYHAVLEELALENEQVKNAKGHIEHLALHDPLTNLPNRMMAQATFERLMTGIAQRNELLGIIFIDLDNLKPINDSLGHQAGDQILKEAAKRLTRYTKNEELACRYGGDEFIVFLPNIKSADDASQASLDILQLISENYLYRNIEIFCTCSIGIALAPQDGDDLDTLIKKADIAMYHSKDSGRNSFRFFNPSINHNMMEHISLISGMRKALQEKQFSLYYQPKIDLQTNRLCGFEALLRWKHAEHGFISPATFIPLAESSGLIIQLGEWVIHEACRQAKIWKDAGLADFRIAVNISSIQFKRGNIDSIVLNALQLNQLAPQYLELELTESLLIEDNERLVSILSVLRGQGLHLSIDDFGTGYSNLGYLKKFAVETIKIDQSFVKKMENDSDDAAIIRAIIQMANSLGLNTIAEGVEDANTAALLRNLGCKQGQGYHWAKPMPAPEAKAFWDQWQADKA